MVLRSSFSVVAPPKAPETHQPRRLARVDWPHPDLHPRHSRRGIRVVDRVAGGGPSSVRVEAGQGRSGFDLMGLKWAAMEKPRGGFLSRVSRRRILAAEHPQVCSRFVLNSLEGEGGLLLAGFRSANRRETMSSDTEFAESLARLDEELARADRIARMASLMNLVSGLDMRSADGRAGISSLLREIETRLPGAIEREAAGLQLARLPTAGSIEAIAV